MINTAQASSTFDDALVQSYRATPLNCYDEMMTADGKVRAHWRGILSEISGMPEAERLTRCARLDRRVRETGIAYDIFSDPNKPSQR